MRIAEVSREFGVSADTLRYYERVGLLQRVERTASGVREYSEQDCARIQFVKCMRGAGMPVEALARYMQLLNEGDETMAARKELLERERDRVQERIAELQAGLDRLNYKIENYEQVIREAERRLEG